MSGAKWWLIWSFEHNGWWAVAGWGYTKDIRKAGLYERDKAEEVCQLANIDAESEMQNGKPPHEVMTPAPAWLARPC